MQKINELKLAKELIRFPSITPIDAGVMKFLEKKFYEESIVAPTIGSCGMLVISKGSHLPLTADITKRPWKTRADLAIQLIDLIFKLMVRPMK